MLPYDGIVDCALADEKLALEVFGLAEQGSGPETVRIALGILHIALSVHDFVPFPVDYRPSGNSDLERLRVIGHQRYCHIAAVTPSVDSDSVPVHIWQCLQCLDSDHLVRHLGLSAILVDDLLVFSAVILRAPVVLNIDNVAVLGHVEFPHPDLPEPGVVDHLRMRATIYVKYYRILLCRVESERLVEPVMVLVLPVGTLHRSEADLSGSVVGKRVRCGEKLA